MSISDLGQLGIGGIIGGLLVQYLGEATGRRKARADARGTLGVVETLKWAGQESEKGDFLRAVREFQSATLIARVPRKAVDEYVRLALVLHTLSIQGWELAGEVTPDESPGGGGAVSAPFADLHENIAVDIVNYLWNPVRTRWALRRRMRALERDLNLTREDPDVRGALQRGYRRA